MARGLPDFGVYQAKAALASMVDSGELAVRLGALPRYDRLGDVVFYEDFSGDLGAWEVEDSGAGETVVVTAERKVTGSFSCKLTTVGAAGSYAGLRCRFPVPYSVMYGSEIQWTAHEDFNTAYIFIDIYTGTHHLAFGIEAVKATAQNYYYTAPGVWVPFTPAMTPYYNDRNFIVSKFTFNIVTGRYSRFLVPPAQLDMSGYSGLIEADIINRPRMEWSGRLYSDLGTTPYSYIDSLILTANDV